MSHAPAAEMNESEFNKNWNVISNVSMEQTGIVSNCFIYNKTLQIFTNLQINRCTTTQLTNIPVKLHDCRANIAWVTCDSSCKFHLGLVKKYTTNRMCTKTSVKFVDSCSITLRATCDAPIKNGFYWVGGKYPTHTVLTKPTDNLTQNYTCWATFL